MTHTLTHTTHHNEDPTTGTLEHWTGHCSCGFTASTTLGSGTFNRTDMFARKDLDDHCRFMNR